MLRPWKLYALEVEKKRLLGVIFLQREHLESPKGAAWKPQATQKGCHVRVLKAGGQSSEPAPAGREAQFNMLQGTKRGPARCESGHFKLFAERLLAALAPLQRLC